MQGKAWGSRLEEAAGGLRRRRWKWIAAIAGGAVVAGLVWLMVVLVPFGYAVLNNPFNDRPFNRSVWLQAANDDWKNRRGPMTDDLRRHYLRQGMTKSAVRKVLGRSSHSENDQKRGDVDYYSIGAWGLFPIDPYCLVIQYDTAGRLVSTRIEGG